MGAVDDCADNGFDGMGVAFVGVVDLKPPKASFCVEEVEELEDVADVLLVWKDGFAGDIPSVGFIGDSFDGAEADGCPKAGVEPACPKIFPVTD